MKSPSFSQSPLNRRQVLTTIVSVGAAASVAAFIRTAAAGETLGFDELYSSYGVLGLKMSDKVTKLNGQPVSMKGFMAPPLKAESNFFVLTEIPLALCPFCSSDADWPDDIVVIYLDRAQTFEQANSTIEVNGRLEVGSWTDPETGFVSLIRIVDASYTAA